LTHILCIETTTDICSVCIATDGLLVSMRETPRSYSHSEVITVFIEECLIEAGISASELAAVAVSFGPGSYTALRIGSSTAKGICFAMDIPLISVDTMKALAVGIVAEAKEGDLIIPMIDARRKEVYHAIYDHILTEVQIVEPLILDDTTFQNLSNKGDIHFCGDGVTKSKDILNLSKSVFHDVEACSKHMIEEAFAKFHANQVEDTAYYTPFYFKGPNITVQKKNILQ